MRFLALPFVLLSFACTPPEATNEPEPNPEPALCSETCATANDGVCDDGGGESANRSCDLGTDCSDCGERDDPSPAAEPSASPGSEPSASPGSEPGSEPSASPGSEPATTPDPTPDVNIACGDLGVATGTLRTSLADIPANANSTVNAAFSHKIDVDPSEDACVSSFNSTVRLHPNGCELRLEFTTDGQGNGALVAASLNADSFCIGISDEEEGFYEFDTYDWAYPLWVTGDFGRVPDAESQTSCFENRVIRFPDEELTLYSPNQNSVDTISVNLKDLQLQGSFNSNGSTDFRCRQRSACPDALHDAGGNSVCFPGISCLTGYLYNADEDRCEVRTTPVTPLPAGIPATFDGAFDVSFPSRVVGSAESGLFTYYFFIADAASDAVFSTWSDSVASTCDIDTVLSLDVFRDLENVFSSTDDDGGSDTCSQIGTSIEAGDVVIVGVRPYSGSIPRYELRME